MHSVPKIVAFSEIVRKRTEILAALAEEPVIISQDDEAVGVLVAPQQWDALLEKLADLSDAIAIMQDELAAARGEETFEDLSQSTLENWLGASRETVPSYLKWRGGAVPADSARMAQD